MIKIDLSSCAPQSKKGGRGASAYNKSPIYDKNFSLSPPTGQERGKGA